MISKDKSLSSSKISTHSKVSHTSDRIYRKRADRSSVEQTLFASDHPDSQSRLQKQRALNQKRIDHTERSTSTREGDKEVRRQKQSKSTRRAQRQSKPFKISREHFEAIKARAVLKQFSGNATDEARMQENRRVLLERRKAAEDRKAKIIELEKHRKLKRKSEQTTEPMQEMMKENAILKRAKEIEEEQLDEVKEMRRKMLYAQCAKVRELQITEKEGRKRKEEEKENEINSMIEQHRLHQLKVEEEIENRKALQRKKDFEMIKLQVKEKQKRKELEEDFAEQEKKVMLEMIRKQEVEEARVKKVRARKGKELLKQVLEANTETIESKKHMREKERQEDELILKWQEEKQRKEAALEREKERLQRQKDREFYEITSNMKRNEDNRAEKDADRAKKHQREQEKKNNEREEKEKERQRDILIELKSALEEQSKRKVEQLKILAVQDKKEWSRICKENEEMTAKVERMERELMEGNKNYQNELLGQMMKRKEKKEKEKLETMEESSRIKKEKERYVSVIRQKKEEILKEMRRKNIPQKYCTDVSRMKIVP